MSNNEKRLFYLKNYLCANNKIKSSNDIISYFAEFHNTKIAKGTIPGMVRKVMKKYNLPICHIPTKGYFVAENDNQIIVCMRSLENRIFSTFTHYSFLSKFLIEQSKVLEE